MLFIKNFIKNLEKKLDQPCFDEIDQFHNFFVHSTSLVSRENSPVMHGQRKFVFMNPHRYFFS